MTLFNLKLKKVNIFQPNMKKLLSNQRHAFNCTSHVNSFKPDKTLICIMYNHSKYGKHLKNNYRFGLMKKYNVLKFTICYWNK